MIITVNITLFEISENEKYEGSVFVDKGFDWEA